MEAKKKGKYWTAFYDPETNRYFAEIMYISREGMEDYKYEITQEIFDKLGSFDDDSDNEELIRTGETTYSFANTMYGTLGPERLVWNEEANEAIMDIYLYNQCMTPERNRKGKEEIDFDEYFQEKRKKGLSYTR